MPFGKKLIVKRGDRVGVLTFLREVEPYIHDRKKYRRCVFLCPCGKETTQLLNAVKCVAIKSCGKCFTNHKGKRKTGEAAANQLYASYRTHAKGRDLHFNISWESFIALTSSNCHYCGLPPSSVSKPKRCDGSYQYNGVDRYDNLYGYEPWNCVPCCKKCNRIKYTDTAAELTDWAERVFLHQWQMTKLYLEHCIPTKLYGNCSHDGQLWRGVPSVSVVERGTVKRQRTTTDSHRPRNVSDQTNSLAAAG